MGITLTALDIQATNFFYSPLQCVCVRVVASDSRVSPQKVALSKPLCSPRSCSLLNMTFWVAIYTEIRSSALTLERKGAWQNPGIRPAGNFRLIFLSSTYSSRLFSDGDSKMYCMACCKFLAGCLNWLSYWQILLLLKTTQSLPWSAAVKKYILAVIPWQEVTLKSSKPV